MAALASIHITSPLPLAAGAALFALAIILCFLKNLPIPTRSQLLFALGFLSMIAAAGQPIWMHSGTPTVIVMVDLSPSTRGAAWRNRSALDQKIAQLLGDIPHQVFAFAESNQPLPPGETLADLRGDQTVFAPPPCDAILLFSDGNFDLPVVAPPTFAVIDPALDHVGDASVKNLEFRDGKVFASVQNTGPPRPLSWSGAIPDSNDPVVGSQVRSATPSAVGSITVSFAPGDLWPENDSLSIDPPPLSHAEKWWIGDRNPGSDWRRLSPEQLPLEPAAYLNAAVIVLDNIASSQLSSSQRDRLAQFARDLGGGVLIVGGNHAFAAGEYNGTSLDTISPLASSPPTPTTHWILLLDSSGSMASDAGTGETRWQIEAAAMTRLLPTLPPNDLATIGAFAETIHWWSSGKSAQQTAALSFPPPDTTPRGPTNLQPALQEIARSADGAMPTNLLLMTDAEANLENTTSFTNALTEKKIHLHLLAIGNGSALNQLRQLATSTGGSVLQQLDPHQWTASAHDLLRSALPDHLSQQPVDVQFTGDMSAQSQHAIAPWNHTWLKPEATTLARAGDVPMAARWQVGEGHVAAIAYNTNITAAKQIAEKIAAPAHDPRFTVHWTEGARLHISVDAIDNNTYLNDQPPQFELLAPTPTTQPIPQTGPGKYELEIAAAKLPATAAVRLGSQTLQRFALAGRYPPEFEQIGNNRANLNELCARTGGALIDSIEPIQFHAQNHETPLSPWLSASCATLIALALVSWKRHRRN